MHQRILSIVVLACVVLPIDVFASPVCTDAGDQNGDCRIDLVDHAAFVDCIGGPGVSADPRCVCFDNDGDNDVDLEDFRAFQQAFTGDQPLAGCDMTPIAMEPAALHTPPVRQALEPLDSREILKDYFEADDVPTGVYDFSGEFYLTAVDLRIAGRGFDFVWSRKYRSKAGPVTATGVNWDYGYNIFLEQAGNDLVLHDGNSRADQYMLVSGPTGNSWCAADFFQDITQEPDGSFTCTFPHRGVWRFFAFDGSTQAGKLSSIADANGNTMTFSYDVTGRLATIVDTLSRPITVSYNTDGRISSVTDFAGRQVTYQYYSASDTLGDAGDLKSVTSPAVTGTPNGNDFPAGKTTVYTYSTGSPDNALNHNLLTITDPKGQTYLTNTYASTLNPLDPDFDRIVRQVLGDPTDIIDYVYETESPTGTNGLAVTRTIVNDQNGHVEERLYDKLNRCVNIREFTGRAIPSSPTSSAVNRPVNKLRATDPDYFETRIEYNGDSLPARIVDPEVSIAEYTYTGDTSFLAPSRAKAAITSSKRIAGPRGGDQTQIVTTFEYDANSNGNTNQVTRSVDGRGNETFFDYDAAGNRTRTTHRIPSIVDDYEYNTFGQTTSHTHPDNGSSHRRRDEFTYYNTGPQAGYLKDSIVDAPGLALTTTYEYDLVGNVTRVVDPRGNDELYDVNQLDQTVRITTRKTNPPSMVRLTGVLFYDANDNIIRVDIENRDETGALQPNKHLTTLYDFDILDKCIRTTREIDANRNVVIEYEYDAKRNRVLVRNGEATNANQPTNTVTTLYDERDLVFQEIAAAGDPLQSTTQFDYDGNGNLVRTAQGLEGNPRVSATAYDGYDRILMSTDATGNTATSTYDPNGNRIGELIEGELVDIPGSAGNVRLSASSYTYDNVDRLVRSDVQFFDTVTQAAIDDGLSSTVYTFSDNSQMLSITDDNGRVTTLQYDDINRVSVMVDPKNNTTTYTYDQNSNVLSVTETEKSDLGLPDEVFVTTYSYDGLDRRISTTDSSGNTHASNYDSRSNEVVTIDPLSNEVRFDYDGLDRLVARVIDLDGDGADGDGADIVLTRVWDDSSRLVTQIDDNGNATLTSYDPLNRPVLRRFADSTSESYTYDVHHNVVNRVDANGSSITSTYDSLNRVTNRNIVVGPGVSADTTFENFTYDGLDRLVSAQDDDSLVQLTWDSLSNMRQESLGGQTATSTYDGVGNRLSCIYPSGRSFDYTYDALDRVATIADSLATVASYSYVGPERIAMQQYGNGARAIFEYDGIQGMPNPANDFGVKRIVSVSHTAGATVVDSRTFTWDPLYNKTERRDTRVGGPRLRHAYQYDDTYRMTNGLEENGVGIVTRSSSYTLDGAGNRMSIGGFGGITGPYVLDPIAPPADFQVNQYTQTPRDNRQYDEKGNLAIVGDAIGTVAYQYDAYDRLVVRSDSITGDTAEYAYDALGRRIRKTITPGMGSPQETRYLYDGSLVIEEQDSNGVTLATYVRGARAADIVCVETGGQVYYHHTDDLGNVMALTDTNGVVIERYEYGDFGAPQFFDGNGGPLQASAVGNLYLFGGHRYDSETGWYLQGSRYFDPENGRYTTRDPSGMWSDGGSHGNAYTYADGNPWSVSRTQAGAGNGRGRQHGKEIQIAAKNKVKFKAGADLSKKVNIAPPPGGGGGGNGGYHGHVTVLKARGGYRGHVTVLKARGRYRGHVTVLKARGGHRGHVTVLKARGGHRGHVTVLKARGGHRGHVTVLKAHGGGDSGVWGSSESGSGNRFIMPHARTFSAGYVNLLDQEWGRGASYERCLPCGMYKALCGRPTTQVLKILPACNNISSR